VTSWAESTARAERQPAATPRPRRRPAAKPKPKPRAVTGGVVWIVLLGVLLAGVVAVNVAVLRQNVELDQLGRERVQLRADAARLQSSISSNSASARVENDARRRLGLVPADPAATSYVELVPRRR
jgi:cell division protein FtsL